MEPCKWIGCKKEARTVIDGFALCFDHYHEANFNREEKKHYSEVAKELTKDSEPETSKEKINFKEYADNLYREIICYQGAQTNPDRIIEQLAYRISQIYKEGKSEGAKVLLDGTMDVIKKFTKDLNESINK